MGGIAGVATFAEARGRGYVDQLLKQSLIAMKDAGQVISALYPFAFAFYRRYGWDWVGVKRNVKLPLGELRATPEGKDMKAISGDETRELLSPGYTAFAQRYRGVFTTESHRWGSKLSHDGHKTTYAYRYEPTGAYLLWRYGDGDSGRVREFTGATGEEYRALLSLLHYFGTQRKEAKLTLPDDSPLWSFLMHWDLETKTEPVFMGRVVDFAGAMAQLRLPSETPDGALTLAVSDPYAPWNEGVWRLTVTAGGLAVSTVVGGSAGEADITADIQAVSQAYWGKPSLDELRAAGRLDVRNEEAYRLLRAILPAHTVYTLDDF